jgi:hypothetical protein
MIRTPISRCLAAALAAVASMPAAAAVNLIQDGGFEALTVASGSYANYALAAGTPLQAGSPWFMDGGTSLNAVHTAYAEGSLVFNAQSGSVSMDLTGTGNTGANRVSQNVPTVTGASYTLGFWVGNADDSRSNYAGPSSINLLVNGSPVGTYTATASAANQISWQPFSYSFAATSGLTKITFENATPAGNNLAGLDNVTMVPEPAEWAMMLAGLGLVALVARRRQRRAP